MRRSSTTPILWLVWAVILSLTIFPSPVKGREPGGGANFFTIEQLMDQLARNPPSIATFTEKKYLSLLDHSLDSSGELQFIPPDRLEKRTLKPRIETLILAGDSLTVINHHQRTRTLQLRDYPEIFGLVSSIRAAMTGNRKAMESAYKLSLEGNNDSWVLKLSPREYTFSTIVNSIDIIGNNDIVTAIAIMRADGDHSVMYIKHTTSTLP